MFETRVTRMINLFDRHWQVRISYFKHLFISDNDQITVLLSILTPHWVLNKEVKRNVLHVTLAHIFWTICKYSLFFSWLKYCEVLHISGKYFCTFLHKSVQFFPLNNSHTEHNVYTFILLSILYLFCVPESQCLHFLLNMLIKSDSDSPEIDFFL